MKDFVYVISGEQGRRSIGCSDNPRQRLKELQTGSPYPLKFEFIGEAVQKSSYLKSPYYSPLGFPDGMYRVGPLARLNVAEQMGTPKADAELKKFKKLGRGAVSSS